MYNINKSNPLFNHFHSLTKKQRAANKKKNQHLFSLLTSNAGINEVSTQTDLSMNDITRLIELQNLVTSNMITNRNISNISPFDLSNYNNDNYGVYDEREFKEALVNKKRLARSSLVSTNQDITGKKKFNKKNKINSGGDIKIFNSVVVNNNDISNKLNIMQTTNETSTVDTPYGKEYYSSRVINLYNENRNKEDDNNDNSDESSSDIGDMLNIIRGKESSTINKKKDNMSFKKKDNKLEKLESSTSFSKNKASENAFLQKKQSNTNYFSNSKEKDSVREEKESNIRDSASVSSSSVPIKSTRSTRHIRNNSRINKLKELNNSRKLDKNTKKLKSNNNLDLIEEETDTKKDSLAQEASTKDNDAELSSHQLNLQRIKSEKRKYDPFNFFLREFTINNHTMNKNEIFPKAKESWAELDKDTKKVYNMLADRERKADKKAKRLENIKRNKDDKDYEVGIKNEPYHHNKKRIIDDDEVFNEEDEVKETEKKKEEHIKPFIGKNKEASVNLETSDSNYFHREIDMPSYIKEAKFIKSKSLTSSVINLIDSNENKGSELSNEMGDIINFKTRDSKEKQ